MGEALEKLKRDAAWLGYRLVKIGERPHKADGPLARWTTALPEGMGMADLPLEECPVFQAAGLADDLLPFNILLRAGLSRRSDILSMASPSELQLRSRQCPNGHIQRGLGFTSLRKIDRWRTMLISCSGDLSTLPTFRASAPD